MVEKTNLLTLSPEVYGKIHRMYEILGTREEFEKHPMELLEYFFDAVLKGYRDPNARNLYDVFESACTTQGLEHMRWKKSHDEKKMRQEALNNLKEELGEAYFEEGVR